MPLKTYSGASFKGIFNMDNSTLSKKGIKMRLDDYFKISEVEKRLLKGVIYTLFITSDKININEAMIRASERFKVSTSDIDIFIENLFSIEL